jgi:hypothetical protein
MTKANRQLPSMLFQWHSVVFVPRIIEILANAAFSKSPLGGVVAVSLSIPSPFSIERLFGPQSFIRH